MSKSQTKKDSEKAPETTPEPTSEKTPEKAPEPAPREDFGVQSVKLACTRMGVIGALLAEARQKQGKNQGDFETPTVSISRVEKGANGLLVGTVLTVIAELGLRAGDVFNDAEDLIDRLKENGVKILEKSPKGAEEFNMEEGILFVKGAKLRKILQKL